MAKFKVVTECNGECTTEVQEWDSLDEARSVNEFAVTVANRIAGVFGRVHGRLVSVEEVNNGNES